MIEKVLDQTFAIEIGKFELDFFMATGAYTKVDRRLACGKVITLGKADTAKGSLSYSGMARHLKVHKEQFKLYQELQAARGKAVTVQQEDLKDETTRGTVPIFNISNHRERQQFLSKVSTVGNGSVG